MLLLAGLLAGAAGAQDLTVSRVGGTGGDFHWFGSSGGKTALAFGTTACNVGDLPIDWRAAPDDRHPVIGQNLFRIHGGRIEQLGQSWLKHGFCAFSEPSCGACEPTGCETLGIGCADTYSAFLNDGHDGAAKFEIDPVRGVNVVPYTLPDGLDPILSGRLVVDEERLGVPGAIYVAEAQYVSEHDQRAGNARNNCSWRRIDTGDLTDIPAIGSTFVGNPAIFAWRHYEGDVKLRELAVEHEGGFGVHGLFFLAFAARELGEGRWRYEYAVQNTTSARAAGSFSIPVPCAGVEITEVRFHDVDYHSGEPYDGSDWIVERAGGSLTWRTPRSWDEEPLGNALRWGTLYNFGFTANRPPVQAGARLGLFEPGTPAELDVLVQGPCAAFHCGALAYCTALPNSTGAPAQLSAHGSTSLAANELVLSVSIAVPGESGLFFYGPAAAQAPFGDGLRCVAAPWYRLLPPAHADLLGDVLRPLDLGAPPMGSGPGAVAPGETWHWQYWYRDPAGVSGFNLSDALRVTFCP